MSRADAIMIQSHFRFASAAIQAACVLLSFASLTSGQDKPNEALDANASRISSLEFLTLEGDVIPMKSLRGKVVVLFFWTTDGPCRAMMGSLRQLADKHAKQGLEIIGVHVHGIDALALDARTQGRASWLEAKNGPEIARSLGVTMGPKAVVLGRDGKVALPLTYPHGATFAKAVAEAMGNAPTAKPTRVANDDDKELIAGWDRRPPHFDDRNYVNNMMERYMNLRRSAPTSVAAARARTKVEYYLRFVELELAKQEVESRHLRESRRLQELEDAGRVSMVAAQGDRVRAVAGELQKLNLALQGEIQYRLPEKPRGEHVYLWRGASGWQVERLGVVRPRSPMPDFMAFAETPPRATGRVEARHHSAVRAIQVRAQQSQEWLQLSRDLGEVHQLVLAPAGEVDKFAQYWQAMWQWILVWGDEGAPDQHPTLATMASFLDAATVPHHAAPPSVVPPVPAPPKPSVPAVRPINIPESVDVGAFRRDLAKTNRKKPKSSRLERERRNLQGNFCTQFEVDKANASFHKVVDNMVGPFRVFWADVRQGTDAVLAAKLGKAAAAKLGSWVGMKHATSAALAEARQVLDGLNRLERLLHEQRWDEAEKVLQSGRHWILRGSPFPLH